MPALDFSHAVWRKSTRSSETGGNCVEVACVDGRIAVRDSKNPGQAAVRFERKAWRTFVIKVKAGCFYRLCPHMKSFSEGVKEPLRHR